MNIDALEENYFISNGIFGSETKWFIIECNFCLFFSYFMGKMCMTSSTSS